MTAVLEYLATTPEDATVVVIPEGVMINYLARRRNPTPFMTFLPSDLLMYGEVRMLDALQRDPPDHVIRFTRKAAEFGFGAFGSDHAQDIDAWIRRNYSPATPVLGNPRSRANGASIVGLARRSGAR